MTRMEIPAGRRLSAGMLLCALLAGAPAHAEVTMGEAAPDFTLKRGDGTPFRLSDLRGNVVVVIFWATWCQYCKPLMPGLQKLKDFYADEPFRVLAVDSWDQGDPQAYMRRAGLHFDLVVDGDRVAEDWGVHYIPTMLVIHGNGQVLFRTNNYDPDDPDLLGVIDAAVNSLKHRR